MLHRKHRCLDARRQVQLGKDMADVQLDGVVADVEGAGDGLVAFAAGQVGEDFALARGQRVEQGAGVLALLVVELDELGGHGGGDDGFAALGALDRVDHFVGFHALQQVAVGACAQGAGEVVFGFRQGKDKDGQGEAVGAQLLHQGDAVGAGHVEVEDEDVGAVRLQQHGDLVGIAGEGGDLDAAALLEQFGEALAEQGVVVDEDDAGEAHAACSLCWWDAARCGNTRRITVPPAGRDSTMSLPFSLAARSRMMVSPKLLPMVDDSSFFFCTPTPSSATLTMYWPFSRSKVMTTWRARACLAMLYSDSWMMWKTWISSSGVSETSCTRLRKSTSALAFLRKLLAISWIAGTRPRGLMRSRYWVMRSLRSA